MIRVLDARFLTTAVEEAGWPAGDAPEIAFVGRSNVGKSSMINALTGRRKLVRVSNTPGRTRTLNFFDVVLERDGTRRTIRLADLPGYGFAKVSKAERSSWERMITTYLERRASLRGVVAIVDAEVGATEDDVRTLAYLVTAGRRVLVAATKLDRLGKSHRKPRLSETAERLSVPRDTVLGFSATEKLGVPEVWESLWVATS
ncbi:MAG TPA: ribosome biogenesis GTP-binding protein YihA/YsxC [Myxococcaceae bacterium]|nr:ribosome biogenesis GTP-binding protein YihA/YsxC [Myxococcaceae bacterium]